MRFELTTPTLARLCSTPELRPRSSVPWPLIGRPVNRGGTITRAMERFASLSACTCRITCARRDFLDWPHAGTAGYTARHDGYRWPRHCVGRNGYAPGHARNAVFAHLDALGMTRLVTATQRPGVHRGRGQSPARAVARRPLQKPVPAQQEGAGVALCVRGRSAGRP